MKTRIQPPFEMVRARRPGMAAFTMVEVAISLGVVAIALVAIIGVLPTGLKVQRENREDTIMNQDGMWWVEALRQGRDVTNRFNPVASRSPDALDSLKILTNHVVAVAVSNLVDGSTVYVNPALVGQGERLLPFGRVRQPFVERRILTNGVQILGLLGRPRYEVRNGQQVTNYVAALVRSMSGPASDLGSVGRELALTYVLTSEVTPMGNYPSSWLDFQAPGLTAEEILVRSNRFMVALNQGVNFSELRLTMSGPVYEWRRDNEARWASFRDPKVFRAVLTGRLFSYTVDERDPAFIVSYLLPGGYRRVTP